MTVVRDDRGLVRPTFMGRPDDNATLPDPVEPQALPAWEEEEQTLSAWVDEATQEIKE